MQALLFEMKPRVGHEEHYFRHAEKLRPILMQHDGLIFLERFKSLSRSNVILSHSLWRDEASIARWRTDREHHKSQAAGRFKHFEDYRIRISHALHYYEPNSPSKNWSGDGSYSDPMFTTDRFIVILRTKEQLPTQDGETFESFTEADSYLCVSNFASEVDGRSRFEQAQSEGNVLAALLARVSRDYGMYDRAEAPQYFKAAEKSE